MFDNTTTIDHYKRHMRTEYTPEDYCNNAPPRTFGSETEYTHSSKDRQLTTGIAIQKGVPQLPYYLSNGRYIANSIAMKNGGELYIDMGELLEYATPECSTPDELVLQERAGEEITLVVTRALGAAASLPDDQSIQLFKRTGYSDIYDSKGQLVLHKMSTGHHENYTTSAFRRFVADSQFDNDTDYQFNEIASYLASRPIWAGVGMIGAFSFSLSQKQSMIDYSSYSDKTVDGEKSPIRFHSERLEIRSGDGNISEWAIRMKYALTSLVLRLIEHDEFPSGLILKGPTLHSNILAENPDVLVPTVSGEMMSGIEHQSRIVDAAYEALSPRNLILPYEERAVEEFDIFKKDFAMTSIRDSDVTALADRVDWATKLHHMYTKGMSYGDIRGLNMRAVAADLQYEQINEHNYARRLHKKLGQVMLEGAAISEATITPPRTRAARRVRAITQSIREDNYRSSDWSSVYTTAGGALDLGQAY